MPEDEDLYTTKSNCDAETSCAPVLPDDHSCSPRPFRDGRPTTVRIGFPWVVVWSILYVASIMSSLVLLAAEN